MIVWANLTKEQRLEFVAPLWTEGKSANEISRLMVGASRNAIIGVVYRAGLRRLAPGASKTTGYRVLRPEPKPKPKREPKPKLSGAQRRKLAAPARLEPRAQAKVFGETKVEPAIVHAPRGVVKAGAFIPLPGCSPVPFGSPGCKWPIGGDGADLLACGERRQDGRSYCPAHVQASRGRWQPEEPEAVETLKWRLHHG